MASPLSNPYVIKHGFRDLDFWIATALDKDWYDPPKPYMVLEYGWIAENISIAGKRCLDGGAQHGHYALPFAALGAGNLILVDPSPANLVIAKQNFELNGLEYNEALAVAIWDTETNIGFNFRGMDAGSIDANSNTFVHTSRLQDIDTNLEVVKLDIEGAEYVVMPEALEALDVEAWIIECHPPYQDKLAEEISEYDYRLDWVNRETMKVEPYRIGTRWPSHSTLFARR